MHKDHVDSGVFVEGCKECDGEEYTISTDGPDHILAQGTITYGHSHSLCNRSCPCFPGCRVVR